MNLKLKVGDYLEHKKGNHYKVIGFGVLESTLEKVVIYEALYNNSVSKIWIRPLSEFTSDRFKIINKE